MPYNSSSEQADLFNDKEEQLKLRGRKLDLALHFIIQQLAEHHVLAQISYQTFRQA